MIRLLKCWTYQGRHRKGPDKWWMEDWQAYPDLLRLARGRKQ